MVKINLKTEIVNNNFADFHAFENEPFNLRFLTKEKLPLCLFA